MMVFQILRFNVLPLSVFLFITWYEKMEVSAWALVNITVRHKFPEDYNAVVSDLLERYIVQPPNATVPLNLEYPHVRDMSRIGQTYEIMKILENMRNGFYVECGAYDGETRSNSLVLERSYNWTGLLIEPDPKNFANLIRKNRKALTSNTCLSERPYPMKVLFEQDGTLGMINRDPSHANPRKKVLVQCFPLYMYLQALQRTTIDYFSLDVEGSELEVLRTIPWDWVNIRVLTVEYTHGRESKEVMRAYMEEQGYFLHSRIPWGPNSNSDFIFVKAT